MSCPWEGSTITARTHPHTRAEYLLPHCRTTVFWARWLTTAFLARASPPSADIGDASLIVTELVANVIRHTESCCRLSLRAQPRHLTVEVHDDGPGRPWFCPLTAGGESGRGLAIVYALAESLEIVDDPWGGKTVRAALSAL
ncbi:ATP-binding protein [Streptomyces chrestomyceticus]|uniref:ATP-binding protein n=1 Tax=Streptomyces chrestomyceticus TaxID=68185 RepID=A0ABU7X333_9ACTN